MTTDIAKAYDAVYAGLRKSPTLQRIWREHVLGAAYPNGFEHLSFLTISELRRLAATLQIGPSETLVDLACGAGGPALWIAKTTSARLVGIDASSVGVAHALDRATRPRRIAERPDALADRRSSTIVVVSYLEGAR